MPDTKINDLPLLPVTADTQFETDIGGVTAGKANAPGLQTYMQNNLAFLTGPITNSDVDAAAGIVDTKLATISTAGKVSNSATTATDSNTANAIISRNVDGDFSAATANLVNINLSSVGDGVLNISSGSVSSEVATSLSTDGTLVRRGGSGLTSFAVIGLASSSTPATPSINFGTTSTGVSGTENQVTVHISGVITATYTATQTEFTKIRVPNGTFANPAISFTSDSYGIYSSGSSINFKVSGTDKVTFGVSTVDILVPTRHKHQIRGKTANFTLTYGERDEIIYVNSASNLTVTLPSSSTGPSVVTGTAWVVVRKGTGAVSLVEDSGVTLLSVDSAKNIANQYGAVTIIKTAANEYHAMGDLVT